MAKWEWLNRIKGKIYRRQIYSFDEDYGDYSITPPEPDINLTCDGEFIFGIDMSEWHSRPELTEDQQAIIRWENRIAALKEDWWLR